MIEALAIPTVLAVLGWLVGFNVLRHLAARAVERESRTPYAEIMLTGQWRQGESDAARRWKNAAIAWFLLVPLLVIAGFVAHIVRR